MKCHYNFLDSKLSIRFALETKDANGNPLGADVEDIRRLTLASVAQ